MNFNATSNANSDTIMTTVVKTRTHTHANTKHEFEQREYTLETNTGCTLGYKLTIQTQIRIRIVINATELLDLHVGIIFSST